MKVIFLVTLILLVSSLIFIKRNNDKSNLLITTIFVIDILYCAHLLLAYILSIFGIKCSFEILSILNILVVFIVILKSYYVYKKIQFQKYVLNFRELFCLIAIFLICIMIGFIRTNNYNDIVYETTDPAVHYKMSAYYSENLELLTVENSSDEMYGNFNHNMTGFYVNCGLFMKVFDNVSPYKIYMLFDIVLLFLMASTFYITCLQIKKVKNNNMLVFLITCLYFGAYCLNNTIFGFGYLGVGILATNLILFTWLLIEDEKRKKKKYKKNFILFVIFV